MSTYAQVFLREKSRQTLLRLKVLAKKLGKHFVFLLRLAIPMYIFMSFVSYF